ncbi:thymidine phosphorylase [Arenibaculum pallidiluteum]|uniref:thymidine phosphorylase n=1 Tax=Arenibaculum pallidiluteum TaxID=2812559 RepID=UPI001A95C297|nr:thymidine phosphorylase [Arenibaculum pallidiluteum]
MLPQETIRRKRDGQALTEAEIAEFVGGVTAGTVTEGQVAAFAMAVFFQGMTLDERVALTRAMTRSGRVMDWRPLKLGGPVLDKHSTGGVGDKVSLPLAPIVAACGGYVPMVSGRGLGHTGGTLDKMGSIPGYVALPDGETFARVVREVGCAIIGATNDIAPADRTIYAVRDVTATVESIPLITASILSKKLAAGLDGLAMDVKFGSGAFMARFEDALELAGSIAAVARGAGLPTTALLTDMNAVLGRTAGNAVEVRESIDMLAGRPADPRLVAVTLDLAAEMLVLGRLAADPAEGRAKAEQALASGAAAERFGRMVVALGGPTDLMEAPDRHLARAPVVREVHAAAPGVVTSIDVRAVGIAIVGLGGGRTRVQDPIDPAVGLTGVAGIGEQVGPGGAPLALMHAPSEAAADAAMESVRAAFTLGAGALPSTPVVARRLAAA